MQKVKFRVSSTTVAVLMIVFGVAGCGSKDSASFVASGQAYMVKADYKAAIIEAKNALQKDRNNGEARLLLATALLETGDAVGAEAEVRKAIELQMPRDRAYPVLARSLIAQRQFAKVTEELGGQQLDKPASRAELAVSLAIAAASRGDRSAASKLLEAALADAPGHVGALLLEAELAGQAGDLAAATKLVDAALKVRPDSLDALMMKASIAITTGKREDAEKLLEQAIAAHPQATLPRFSLIALAVRSGKAEVAKEQLAKVKQLAPRDLRASYSEALVASMERDNARAREAIQRVLAAQPDNLPSLLLSGLIDLQLGSYAAAEDSLRKVVARAPDEPSARRALATLYLRQGLGAQALETLEPALRRNPDNPLLLRAAGEAYLAMGNPTLAAGSYERANAVDKDNIPSQVRLAQVRLAAGDTARALGDLESLSAGDSTNYQAELALFTAHMRRREFDKALAVTDGLASKQPKLALVPSMRGIAYLAKRDMKNARMSFEKALDLQSDYLPAMQSLALIDIQEGKLESARQRYDRILATNPKDEQALLASVDLMTITGATPEQVNAALQKAIRSQPSSVRVRLAMINYNVRLRNGKAAVAAAQSALSDFPNDVRLLDALAKAEKLGGDAAQAVATYQKAVEAQPTNGVLLLRLAENQAGTKDYAGAIENARKALALKPEMTQAWGVLARIHVMSGHPEAAIAEARKLQKMQPDKAAGFALEGDVLSAQKKWLEASTAYRQALSRQAMPPLAALLYTTTQRAGKPAEATAFGEKWMKEHPKDATLPLMFAEQSQRNKDFPAAIVGYKRVLEIVPDHVVALNNVAWLLAMNKDPTSVEYAEQAQRVAPLNPDVLDTLGWALLRSGEAKRAVQVLRMASSISPGRDQIRLHLAQALADAGDKPGARKEIDEITKAGRTSPIRDEAEKLQATL